jgi:hypothetical protein
LHTRYLVVKELLAIAGMIPQPTPTTPPPRSFDGDAPAPPPHDDGVAKPLDQSPPHDDDSNGNGSC